MMAEFEDTDVSKSILVTGFGPFGIHQINASWEAVKLLPDVFKGYKIFKYEVPVSYTDVENKIPKLWTSLKPELVIHVGVSSEARKITIEQKANRIGYERLDCYGQKHPTGEACLSTIGEDCISTNINVKDICAFLNSTNELIKYEASENAGRYLCEYIYYTSLRQDNTKCIFIHVPPLGFPFSAQQLSDGLLQIIEYILNQGCLYL